jgi:undecaprenyl-diphosphatase
MQSTSTFTEKYLKKIPIGLIVLLLLFIGVLLLFVFIAHEVFEEKEEAMDTYVFDFLSAHVINPELTTFMKGITYFASARFLQVAYGLVAFIYVVRKNFKRVIELAVVGVGGFFINYVMKMSFHRLRPPNPLIDPLHNFSFPSGHATSAFIFYGLLVYLIWKTEIPKGYKYLAGCLLVLFSLLIGFSRVYLRVHYPSDVLAGFCIGFAWLLLAVSFMEQLKKKSGAELNNLP